MNLICDIPVAMATAPGSTPLACAIPTLFSTMYHL